MGRSNENRARRWRALIVCCAFGCMPVAIGQQTSVNVPEIRMIGNRAPVPIQTPTIRITGNRAPVPIQVDAVRMVGNRSAQPITTQPIVMTGNRGIEEP